MFGKIVDSHRKMFSVNQILITSVSSETPLQNALCEAWLLTNQTVIL